MSTTTTYPIVRLGLIADHKRKIKNGFEYDRYFPKANLKDTIINTNGNVYKTVEEMEKIVNETLYQTEKIAPLLNGKNLVDTCSKIWHFIYEHIQYKLDKEGTEELREPSRSWYDRFTGIDCDCMAIFASSILTNLNIRHKLRVTKYDANWQHVYVIVPLPENTSKYYVIDCVLDGFNVQKTFTDKFDHRMETKTLLGGIPIARLSGMGNATVYTSDELNRILNGYHFKGMDETIEGLGAATDEQNSPMLKHIYDHIVATRDYIRKNPDSVDVIGGAKNHLKMLDYAIANFYKGEEARSKALDILEREEKKWNEVAAMGAVADAMDNDEVSEIVIEDFIEGEDVDEILEGLGKGLLKTSGQKFFSTVKTAVKTVNKVNKTIVAKSKEAVQNAGTKIGEAAKKTVEKAKEIAKKAVGPIKKFLVMSNPLTLLMRAGFLLAMKVNLFQMAERLYPGYLTESEAKSLGLSTEMWNKSKAAVEKVGKVFEAIGGKRSKLEKYIKTGRAAKKLQVSGFNGLGQEPYSTAAAAIAAAATIMTAAAKMKEAGVNKADYDRLKKKETITPAKKKTSVKGIGEEPNTDTDGSEVIDQIPADESAHKGFLPKVVDAIKKFFGKHKELDQEHVSDIIQEEEAESTTDTDSSGDGGSSEGFFSKAKNFVKNNPGISIAGGLVVLAGASLAFPAVRKKVFGKKPAAKPALALSGVKKKKKKTAEHEEKPLVNIPHIKRITIK